MSKNKRSLLEGIFNLPAIPDSQLEDQSAYLRELKIRLQAAVEFLLDNNTEKLFNILYRIDVPDSLIQESFNLGRPHLIAERIAEEIIQRELKKLESQRNYKGE